jgi:hypothetical protein
MRLPLLHYAIAAAGERTLTLTPTQGLPMRTIASELSSFEYLHRKLRAAG